MNSRTFFYAMLVAVGLCAFAHGASAADPPGSVDPGQLIERFEEKALPQSRPAVIPPKAEKSDAAATDGVVFVLKQARVGGMTVYTQAQIDAVLKPWLGTTVGFADLEKIAHVLTAKYRSDGYILSYVELDAQDIEDGAVQFRAVEGYVSAVSFEGDTSNLDGFLKAQADRVTAQHPLQSAGLERALLLIDDLPGMTVKSLFAPGEHPGSSHLTVILTHDRFEGLLMADNRAGRYLGPGQVALTGTGNGIVSPFGRTTLRAVTSVPAERMTFFDLTQTQQLGWQGLKLEVHMAATDSSPRGNISNLGINGDSKQIAAKISYPFLRSRGLNLTGYSGFQVLNTHTDVLGAAFSKDRVRALEAGMTLDFADRLAGSNLIDFSVRQGLKGLGATENGAGRTHVNGEQDFTSLRAELSRLQPLPLRLSAFVSAQGQYAFDALLASEEFSVGGARVGRGYDASEITGDLGAAVLAELRYDGAASVRGIESYQVYGFYDLGAVWNRNRVLADSARLSLASAGFGARLNVLQHYTASAEAAFPLTRPLAAGGGTDTRLFFKLGRQF